MLIIALYSFNDCAKRTSFGSSWTFCRLFFEQGGRLFNDILTASSPMTGFRFQIEAMGSTGRVFLQILYGITPFRVPSKTDGRVPFACVIRAHHCIRYGTIHSLTGYSSSLVSTTYPTVLLALEKSTLYLYLSGLLKLTGFGVVYSIILLRVQIHETQ